MDFSIAKIKKDSRFSSQLGGYSYQEVDETVSEALGELEALKIEHRELAMKVRQAQFKFNLINQMRDEIVDLIVNSQNYLKKITWRAKCQAKVTVNFANTEAKQIIDDANKDAKQAVLEKIEDVKMQTDTLNKLKQIVACYQQEILAMYKQRLESFSALAVLPPMVAVKTSPANTGKVISIELDDQQVEIDVNTTANNSVSNGITSQIDPAKVKISDVKTKINNNDEVMINLSLVVSK